MAEHDGTFKPGWKRMPFFLLVLAGLAIVLTGIALVSLHTHAESQANTEHDDILIANSGSTNTPGSTLTIKPDGSGSMHYEKGHWPFRSYKDRMFPAHTFAIDQFKTLIAEIKDMRSIPNHGCPKSVSFGSTITMTYDGEKSGDISCLSMQDGKTLNDLRILVQNTYSLITK